jgi:hypothetical protein
MTDGKIEVDGSFADCVAAAEGKLDFVSHNEGDKAESKEKQSDESTSNVIEEDETRSKQKTPTLKVSNNDEQAETKVRGLVSKATFLHYARSMGGWFVAVWILCLFTLSQTASLACIAMIGRWSELSLEQQVG